MLPCCYEPTHHLCPDHRRTNQRPSTFHLFPNHRRSYRDARSNNRCAHRHSVANYVFAHHRCSHHCGAFVRPGHGPDASAHHVCADDGCPDRHSESHHCSTNDGCTNQHSTSNHRRPDQYTVSNYGEADQCDHSCSN